MQDLTPITYRFSGGSASGIAEAILANAVQGAVVGAQIGAVVGGIAGLIQTGSLTGAIKGAFNGAIAGAKTGFIGGAIGIAPVEGANAFINASRAGFTSGLINKIQGHSFSNGFKNGALGYLAFKVGRWAVTKVKGFFNNSTFRPDTLNIDREWVDRPANSGLQYGGVDSQTSTSIVDLAGPAHPTLGNVASVGPSGQSRGPIDLGFKAATGGLINVGPPAGFWSVFGADPYQNLCISTCLGSYAFGDDMSSAGGVQTDAARRSYNATVRTLTVNPMLRTGFRMIANRLFIPLELKSLAELGVCLDTC